MGLRFSNTNNLYATFTANNFDTDAQAFISAAGITSALQQKAVNTLTTSLKGNGLWTKMKAIYPMVGGTATTHKWNLKDPRDLNAAFRLTFSGGWTHSSTGAKPDGINGYADTFLNLSTAFTLYSAHYSFYIRNNIDGGADIGVTAGTPFTSEGWSAARASNIAHGGFYDNDNPTNSIRVSNTDSTGFYVSSVISNISTFMTRNTTTLGNVAPSSSPANTTIYIGAIHQASTNTAILFTNHEYGFVSIGNGLTIAESNTLYSITQAFQTTLGRQV